MVNPIKWIAKTTGISKLFESETPAPAAAAPQAAPAAPAPQPAPVLGQEPAPKKKGTGAAQTFGPAVLGQAGASVGDGQGKTLLGS